MQIASFSLSTTTTAKVKKGFKDEAPVMPDSSLESHVLSNILIRFSGSPICLFPIPYHHSLKLMTKYALNYICILVRFKRVRFKIDLLYK